MQHIRHSLAIPVALCGLCALMGQSGTCGLEVPAGDTTPCQDCAQGPKGDPGPRGEKGDKGDKGDKGEQGEKGDDGATGKTGEIGPTPEHEWIGTSLKFRKPDGNWGESVNLRGPQGSQGIPGPSGAEGPKGDPGDSFWEGDANAIHCLQTVGIGSGTPSAFYSLHVPADGIHRTALFDFVEVNSGHLSLLSNDNGQNGFPVHDLSRSGKYTIYDSQNGDTRVELKDQGANGEGGAISIYSDTVPTIKLNGPDGSITCTTLNQLSDRNMKNQIARVTPRQVLEQLCMIPISTWQYNADGSNSVHMGPMAQDFSAAFGLGSADTLIATVDADGVAMAAIQGLHQLVKEQGKTIDGLQARIDELSARLVQLERQPEVKHIEHRASN